MKISKLWLLPIAMMLVLVIGYAPSGYAAEHGVSGTGAPVVLKDAGGNAIAINSSTPYSPKQTCGMAAGACHNYESDVATVTKDHGPGTTPYSVKAPQHGVSAGYHFQQGRNIEWNSNNNNAQRTYYGLAKFTSSPGMYGKY